MEIKESKHGHHIIPRYRCKELDIDKNFKGNIIYLTRLEHAWVHWWMWCNEKKDVYNLLESKGVDLEGIQMPNSTGCIKNHIPWHDRNDSRAAGVVGLGQIDGIDMSGENNPAYIDGRCMGENWWKEYNQRPERKKYRRQYHEDNKDELLPKLRENSRKHYQRNKKKKSIYSQLPEVKERNRKYRLSKKYPILDIFSGAIL